MECKHTTILKQKRALIIIKLLKKLDVETVLEILKTITKKRLSTSFFQNILLVQLHTGLHFHIFQVQWNMQLQFRDEALKPNMEVAENNKK